MREEFPRLHSWMLMLKPEILPGPGILTRRGNANGVVGGLARFADRYIRAVKSPLHFGVRTTLLPRLKQVHVSEFVGDLMQQK